MENIEKYTFTLTEAYAGQRLDKALDALLPDLSRERLKGLIKEGQVLVNGVACTQPAAKMRSGMVVELTVPAPVALDVVAQNIPLDILYEDAHLIVVNKPAGLAVHPAPGTPNGTLVNALLHHCKGNLAGIGGVERPGIVHRLDKDTSGVMVVAKDDKTHQNLVEQFQSRTIERLYEAVCYGVPNPPQGRYEGNIGRHPVDRKKMAVLAEGGKPAATRYKVLKHTGGCVALVVCKLETGRTHQIRVHFSHFGHPLVGDPVYGKPKKLNIFPQNVQEDVRKLNQQLLHAKVLGFTHPITGESLRFEQAMPPLMSDFVEKLFS